MRGGTCLASLGLPASACRIQLREVGEGHSSRGRAGQLLARPQEAVKSQRTHREPAARSRRYESASVLASGVQVRSGQRGISAVPTGLPAVGVAAWLRPGRWSALRPACPRRSAPAVAGPWRAGKRQGAPGGAQVPVRRQDGVQCPGVHERQPGQVPDQQHGPVGDFSVQDVLKLAAGHVSLAGQFNEAEGAFR